MKRLVGILIVVQAILTLIIVYEMRNVANTIMHTGAYIANNEGQLTGTVMPTIYFVILGIIGIVALYLIFSKDKPTS